MGPFDRLLSDDSGQPESNETKDAAAQDAQENAGWLERFRHGLQKTARLLNTDVRDLFKQQGRLIDDDFLDQLFAILIKTDMGTGPASAIRDRVKAKFRGRVVQMSEVLATVKYE